MQRRIGEPFAADHYSVALLRDIAALLEKTTRAVTGIDNDQSFAARTGEFFQRVGEHGADALPGHRRMHVKHVDLVVAGERGKAYDRAGHGRDQRQRTAERFSEGGRVVGGGGPGFALRLGIILAGQLLDAGAENLAQQRRIGREIRPQRHLGMRLRAHRAISQVVPSLESFSTTPIAASSSRMRSDSAKSLRARAAVRVPIKAVTRDFCSVVRRRCTMLCLLATMSSSINPNKSNEPNNCHGFCAKACSLLIANGVFKSSSKDAMKSGGGRVCDNDR